MYDLQEFFKRVETKRKRLGISNYPAWYRGHAHSDWPLLPSILRRKNGIKHERDLFAIFKTEGSHYLNHLSNPSSWEVLGVMQHHRVPTRLLDWTKNINVALFFALKTGAISPCLWIANPFSISRASTGLNIIYDEADRVEFDYFEAVRDDHWPYGLPFSMAPPYSSNRIAQQEGCFTVHGMCADPIERSNKDCVKKIKIPSHLIKVIRSHLRDTGFNSHKLFPDADGLARKLRDQFRFP